MAGETANLIALSVKQTQAYAKQQPAEHQQSQGGGAPGPRYGQQRQQQRQDPQRHSSPRSPRLSSQLGSQLANRRRDTGAVYDPDAKAIYQDGASAWSQQQQQQQHQQSPGILTGSTSSRRSARSSDNLQSNNLDRPSRPFPPVLSSPSSHNRNRNPRGQTGGRPANNANANANSHSNSNSKPKPRRPNTKPGSRLASLSSSSSGGPGVSPLNPDATTPSKVHYPSLDLAALVERDLRQAAVAAAAAVQSSPSPFSKINLPELVEDTAVKLADRTRAKQERKGDYSRWMPAAALSAGAGAGGKPTTTTGKGAKGATSPGNKNDRASQVIERAAQTLAGNSSVPLHGRKFLLGQLDGLLRTVPSSSSRSSKTK